MPFFYRKKGQDSIYPSIFFLNTPLCLFQPESNVHKAVSQIFVKVFQLRQR